MSDHRRSHFRNWIHGKIHKKERESSSPSAPADPASTSPETEPTALSGGGITVDNVAAVIDLVQQIANIVQKVPVIAPAAALMSVILKAYKEVKDTNEKRDALLMNITDLSRDLCGAVLWMDATNHLDLIGRLKKDIETYAGLLKKASTFIKEYDNQRALTHLAARTELGNKFSALSRELDSFGARFRTNRLVDLAINQRVDSTTLNKIHDTVLEGKLEKWLQSPDMKQKHLETLQLRKDGTGLWLLEGDMLINWQDNPGLLWIMGRSGTGKSVLSSAVIANLGNDMQLFNTLENCPPSPAIAFFYFDFKDKEGQAMDSALRRMVLQLSAQSPHPYRALEQQYKSKFTGQTLPTYQDLLKILEELLLEIGRTYIVLDALDECKEPDHPRVVDFILRLHKWSKSPLHLLITSQPRQIFADGFGDIPSIMLESDLMQADIKLFVVNELRKLQNDWAHRAADPVVRKSDGMFRLAACLIVQISHCRWEEGLNETLDNLPNDLFGIYDRFLEAIRPEDFAYAEAALRWIMVSGYRIDLRELADAVAFDFSDPTQYIYKPNRREGNQIALPKWFEGLAIFNEYSVTLAHASVEDYLLSEQFTDQFGCNLSASHSHTFIAQTCVAYLLHFSDNLLDDFSDYSLDNTPWNYPLAKYAATNWCHHLLCSHNQTLLFAGAMRLLADGSQQYRVMIRLQRRNNPGTPLHFCCQEGYTEGVRALLAQGADPNAAEEEQGTCLYEASNRGHLEIIHLLLESGADVNATDRQYRSALQAASSGGHTDLVRLLLETGADVNAIGGYYGSALVAASSRGHMDLVRLLLDHGADGNAPGREYGGALQAATLKGHTDLVCLLLENGADVNATGGKYGSALQAAASGGHTDLVRILLETGADVNATGGKYGSALQAASSEGHTDLVRLLLEKGADVNATGGEYGSALQAASSEGHTDLVRLLLENGADVNATGGEYGSVLQAASSGGHTDLVRLLLEKGADVNATGGHYGSALEAASSGGHTDLVRLLLETSADVNATGGYYGSALEAASSGGHTDLVRLLLETGADVNARGGYYGSALEAASSGGHMDLVRLLLETGADVNTTGRGYGSALQAASSRGHTDLVRLLLETGADVNTTGRKYGSALQAASSGGHTDLVRLLLEKGADVNATGGYYGSALQAASSRGHTDLARLLLEKGADVNAPGGQYGSALQAASGWGRTDLVRLLLETGADVNATGREYESALQAASLGGHTDVVRLLLENGADVNTAGGYFGSALQAVTSRGHTGIVDILREIGARDGS